MRVERITDTRVYLSMPNPWIIHEFVVCGYVSKKHILKSMEETLRANGFLGLRVSMNPDTGEAFLTSDESLPVPILYSTKFQKLKPERQAELLEKRHLIFAEVFRLERKKAFIRLFTHHVICDGKGGSILVNDFIRALNACIRGKDPDLHKRKVPVKDYFNFMKNGPEPSLTTRLITTLFNKFIASRRPRLSYEEMLALQKKAFLKDGFAWKSLTFGKNETKEIIETARKKEISVTPFLLEKIASACDYPKTEVSVSIDGRKYFDLPENSSLLPPKENPSNFATGGKIIIDRRKHPLSERRIKNIVKQISRIRKTENATRMIKLFSTMNFSPIDITNKKYAKIPMTREEIQLNDSISRVMGFKTIENGFDFASFGKIEFVPTDRKYSIEDYRLILNTTSVYPLKFGITTYKGIMSIRVTYKPSLVPKKKINELMAKIRNSVLYEEEESYSILARQRVSGLFQ